VLYPSKTEPLPNPRGMAPGFHCKFEGCDFYFLPGVPSEMDVMFDESVLPRLGSGNLLARQWKCLGVWESELQNAMDPVDAQLPPSMWLGYRTRFPENHLTLYAQGDPEAFAKMGDRIAGLVEKWTYTETGDELEALVLKELEASNRKLALAESCTGGLIAQRLSSIPGASGHFWGEYTVYTREAKEVMLGVTVSSEAETVAAATSRRLAEAASLKCGSVGAAVTGYLEPGGGNERDPVGMIYWCVAEDGQAAIEERIHLPPRDRKIQAWGASTYVLHSILTHLRRTKK
jgi:nicotinamide-nucleotide amidase